MDDLVSSLRALVERDVNLEEVTATLKKHGNKKDTLSIVIARCSSCKRSYA